MREEGGYAPYGRMVGRSDGAKFAMNVNVTNAMHLHI
jgi:hypothetical protein